MKKHLSTIVTILALIIAVVSQFRISNLQSEMRQMENRLNNSTGITWRLTLFTLNYEPSMNYMRLAFAWIEVLCFVVMVIITILRFQKKHLVLDKQGKCLYVAGWIVFALLFIPLKLDPLSGLSNIRYMFLDWIKVGLFTALVITTLRLIKTHKAKASVENHHNL